jgi:hypothetical protein
VGLAPADGVGVVSDSAGVAVGLVVGVGFTVVVAVGVMVMVVLGVTAAVVVGVVVIVGCGAMVCGCALPEKKTKYPTTPIMIPATTTMRIFLIIMYSTDIIHPVVNVTGLFTKQPTGRFRWVECNYKYNFFLQLRVNIYVQITRIVRIINIVNPKSSIIATTYNGIGIFMT